MLYEVAEVELHYKSKVKKEDRVKVKSSKDLYECLKGVYDYNRIEHKEMFYCMYLNRGNEVLAVLLIGEGGSAGVGVDIRMIFQGALKTNASSIVMSHNHPSGNLTPSQQDRSITHAVIKGAELLGYEVLDHVILSSTDYFSFADDGILR